MGLPSLASIEDVEARLGGPITVPADRARAAALISDASTLVRHETGRQWVDEMGALTAVPDIAVTIAIKVAIRAFINPAEITSTQLGAASIRFGDVWLTANERRALTHSGSSSTGLVSVDTSHGFGFEGRLDEGWAPVDYGQGQWVHADPFPMGT